MLLKIKEEGCKFFQTMTDSMAEHVTRGLKDAITYTLRKEKELDLHFIKFSLVTKGEGQKAAIIPVVEVNDKFKKYVTSEDLNFNKEFSLKIRDKILTVPNKVFYDAFKRILEGEIYQVQDNIIEKGAEEVVKANDVNSKIASAMVATVIVAIIKDLNENKGPDKYIIDNVIDIFSITVEEKNDNVKVVIAPHKNLKQVIKNDLK